MRPFVASFALLALLLVGCRAEPTPGSFTDDLGRTIDVPERAERIIPLAPSLTEVVAAAAGVDRLVAVSPFDGYPPETNALPQISVMPFDFERALALGADMALGTVQVNNPADGDRLGALGIPAAYLRFETLDDVPRALRIVGGLLGSEARADSAAAAFEDRLAAFEPVEGGSGRVPRTLVLIGDDVLYAFGGASYVHEMVRLAGGESLTASFSGEGVTLSEEFVLTSRPEVVVVLAGPHYDTGRLSARHPTFRTLPAVEQGRVCGVDADLVSRPGPRLVDGINAIRDCLSE